MSKKKHSKGFQKRKLKRDADIKAGRRKASSSTGKKRSKPPTILQQNKLIRASKNGETIEDLVMQLKDCNLGSLERESLSNEEKDIVSQATEIVALCAPTFLMKNKNKH